jgi:hypothetical protein
VEPPEAPAEERHAFHIFINYRREQTASYAGRLYDALSERFGDDHVFMDIDAINPGEDFGQVVEKSVGSCDVLIALIGRHWLETKDREGRRRLDKPHDWVRMEIKTALDRENTRVIPTLVQGAEMPGPDELPEALRKLSHRNAVELSDGRWHYDVRRLIAYLEELAGLRAHVPAARPQAPSAAQPARARPRWLVPAAVGAAALVAIIIAVVLLAGGGGGRNAEEAQYVRQIDSLLTHSAQTKGDLTGLIERVENRDPNLTRQDALSAIDRIIAKRETLAESLPVDPPSSYRHAQGLLRNSIVASKRDDEAVKEWIVSFYADSPDQARLRRKFGSLGTVASEKKRAFLEEYNDLRRRKLDLAPTNPSY